MCLHAFRTQSAGTRGKNLRPPAGWIKSGRTREQSLRKPSSEDTAGIAYGEVHPPRDCDSDGRAVRLLARGSFPTASPETLAPVVDFSPAVVKRLSEAGAGMGEVQIAILWNDASPPELTCEGPSGAVLDEDNRGSPSGGAYAAAPGSAGGWASGGVAAATWPAGRAPAGRYKVYLAGPRKSGPEPTAFVCAVRASVGVEQFSAAADGGGPKKLIYEFVQRPPGGASPWRRAAGDGAAAALLALGLVLGLTGVRLGAPNAGAALAVAVLAAAACGFLVGAGADGLWDLFGRSDAAARGCRIGAWLVLGAGLGCVMQGVARGAPAWRGPAAGVVGGLLGAGLREGSSFLLPPLAARWRGRRGSASAWGWSSGRSPSCSPRGRPGRLRRAAPTCTFPRDG